jgi:hypothetical protein
MLAQKDIAGYRVQLRVKHTALNIILRITVCNGAWVALLSIKTTDIVSGGVWGRRPHTLSEPTLLVNKI